jgi:hypothetical protein
MAGKTYREEMLVHVNRVYDDLFTYNEEDVELLLKEANRRAHVDIQNLFKKQQNIPCIQIPVRIDLSGTFVQHNYDTSTVEPEDSFSELDRIYTRCLVDKSQM